MLAMWLYHMFGFLIILWNTSYDKRFAQVSTHCVSLFSPPTYIPGKQIQDEVLSLPTPHRISFRWTECPILGDVGPSKSTEVHGFRKVELCLVWHCKIGSPQEVNLTAYLYIDLSDCLITLLYLICSCNFPSLNDMTKCN